MNPIERPIHSPSIMTDTKAKKLIRSYKYQNLIDQIKPEEVNMKKKFDIMEVPVPILMILLVPCLLIAFYLLFCGLEWALYLWHTGFLLPPSLHIERL